MRRALILLTACLAVAQVSAAEAVYIPPQPGTMVTWKHQFGDDSYVRLSEVVASGEDFAIYNPDISQPAGKPADFLVEFSGLHSQRCDEAIPTETERAALAQVWPLVTGATATVRSGVRSAYTVNDLREVPVISSFDDAQKAWGVDAAYGDVEMKLSVSPVLGMPIRIDWESGDHAQVLEVIEPQGSVQASDADGLDLGHCGELLK